MMMASRSIVSCPRTLVFFRLKVSLKSFQAWEKWSISACSFCWVWVVTAASSANSMSLMRASQTFVADNVGAYMLIRMTGSVVELRRRVRRHWEPPLPGSTILSKLFLTANPTPCSLGPSEHFPCQKNMLSFSFRIPESASLVSWIVAMSTAVFLESLMACREASHQSGHSNTIFRLFRLWLPGAMVAVCFSGGPLSPCTQWGWQTVVGQHLTGWGLPSLRRAIAVQWDPRISPTIGSNSWRHTLRQLSDGL